MLIFTIFNVFIIDNQRGILSYQIRQLPCRAQGVRAHNLVSYVPFRMDSLIHGFFFLFVNRKIGVYNTNNQTLDALI